MKRCYLAVIFLMLIADLQAQNILEINIAGIRNTQGDILLQIYNEKHEVVDQRISAITGNSCQVKFENLKPGKYAVRYFHDENRSGKLELSRLGIPKEGFGYSNNAAARFGPPSFDKWLFNLTGNLKLELKITYLD